MLSQYRFLSVLVILFLVANLHAQTCQPAPAGTDDCQSAPLLSCNLDGYVGTSGGYTPGPPPDDFCGLVENNQYLRFVADESPVILQIIPSNCTTAKGLQAALYTTSNCIDFSRETVCASFGNVQPLNVIVDFAVIGQEYYLMIDGFEGDVCDFTINVVSGIIPDVEAVADNAEICLGNQIQLDGTASTQRANVEYYWTTTNGNIVSGENTMQPTVDAIGDYTLTVIDVVECCIDEIIVSVTENMDSPTFNFDPAYVITCNDLSLTLDPNLSSPSDYSFNWTTTDGSIDASSSTASASIIVNGEGTYNLEIEDNATGCTFDQDVIVTEDNQDPDVMVTSTNDLDCNNTNTTIEAQSTISPLTYAWTGPSGFTSTARIFAANEAGMYEVIITAANGCTNSANVLVNSIGNPDANISKERDLDCNITDSRLTGSSATPGVSYAWTGPSGSLGNMAEIIVTDPGTYTLVVSLPSGCSTTVTEVVIEDDSLPNINATVSNELNCNVTSAVLEGSSSTMGASFSWVGPDGFTSTMAQPTVMTGGLYTLTVTGPNGCVDDTSVTVNVDAATPVSDAGMDQLVDCVNETATIGGGATSIGSDFMYAWTLDGNPTVISIDPTLSVTDGGTYTLLVTNTINNCTATSSVVIDEDKVLPIADAGGDAFLTCSSRSVDLGVATTTGPEITYTWTDANGVVVSNDPVFNTTIVGTYSLEVRNTLTGCVNNDVAIVDEDPYEPVAVVADPNDLTCEFTSITLESTGSTSGMGIEYQWFDNNNALISTDPNPQVSNPGSYMLIVTDTNVGCVDSTLVRVDENVIPPLGSAGVDMNLDCVNNEVTLEASVSGNLNDFTFEWFDDTGMSVGNDFQYTTNLAGQYDLVITDKVNMCTRTSFATVGDNRDLPDVDAGSPAIVTCANQFVQIGGANSSTGTNIIHEWFDSSGDLVGNTPTIMVEIADTYELVVTNASTSCSAQQLVVVSEDKVEPQAAIMPSALLTCFDPTSTLDGSLSTASNGALEYEWTDATGTLISDLMTADVTTAGTYTLTVMDTQNGCENVTTVEVAEDKVEPVVEVTNPEIINCYNSFVEVDYNSLSGPISPVWTDLNGTVLSTDETYLATQIGTVVLQAQSQSNGCIGTSSIDIVEDMVEPEATIAEPELLSCITEQTDLVPTISNFTTDATYTWTNNLGATLGNDANLTVTTGGIYTLEILNVDNGCTATFMTTVVQDVEDPVAVINNLENRVDCFQPTIDIDATMSTGNAPLTYNWTNEDANTISDLETFQLGEGGLITLEVTNTVNGCTATASVNITEDLEAPSIDFEPVDKLTCVENTVLVQSAVAGSNNSFAYTWEGPGSTGIVSGVNDADATVELIGDYTLTVQDQINGCTSTAQVTVEEDRILPDVAVAPIAELNCVTDQVTIDATSSSAGSAFTYTWSGPSIVDGDGTSLIEVDAEGDYNLLVINTETGCENTIDVSVIENEERPVGATLIMEDPTCYGDRDGVLDVQSVQGGTAPFLYAVNSETNFTDIAAYNNLPAGDYRLIVQDDIGCQWDTLFQIFDPEEVTADLGADQVIRLGESSELFVQTSGDVVSISWIDNGDQGPIDVDFREIQPVRTTNYIVVVTNEVGCQGTDNVVVEVEDDRRVYIPNAFSPNGDGVNDSFTVFTDIAAVEVSSLIIFDKWGNQVFERNNFMPNIPELGWNGEWRGKQMQPGSYVYSAFIEFVDGTKINFKGEINIVY